MPVLLTFIVNYVLISVGPPVPDSGPSLFVRIRNLFSTSKKSKKNLDFFYFVRKIVISTTGYFVTYFLSLKTDINVPYLQNVPNKQKTLNDPLFFVVILSATDVKGRIGS